MLVEVNGYLRNATRGLVKGFRMGGCQFNRPFTASLVSIRQETRNYSSSRETKVYSMVLSDHEHFLFKAVLNSGLSPQVENDVPKVGATVSVIEHKAFNKTSNEQNVCKGVVFIDKLSWKQPPNVPSVLAMCDRHITPTVVESDHNSAFFESEFIDSVCDNCTFSPSESHSTETAGTLLFYCVERKGHQLKRCVDNCECGNDEDPEPKRCKLSKQEIRDLGGETSEEEDRHTPRTCDCVVKCECCTCSIYIYPLEKIDTEDLFEQVRDRLGDDKLVAPCWERLPKKKQRWCYHWWYSINIFHLKTKATALPSCFVAHVRRTFPEDKKENYTGFKSTDERLELE